MNYQQERNQVVQAARALIGTPYKLGAEYTVGTPLDKNYISEMDCSELVQHCYQQPGLELALGYQMPDGATAQRDRTLKEGRKLSRAEALATPGNLAFFTSSTTGNAPHVAITLGDGKSVIHSFSPRLGITSAWTKHRGTVAGFDVFVDPFPGDYNNGSNGGNVQSKIQRDIQNETESGAGIAAALILAAVGIYIWWL